MSIIDRILRPYIEKAVSEQRKNIGSDVYQSLMKYIGRGQPAYLPDNVESYVTDGYLFNPIVYSIVSFIAQKVATVPWMVYNVKDDNGVKLLKSAGAEITVKSLLLRKKALEENKDHELNELFKKPNPLQGWAEYIEQVAGFKLITGESFIHCIGPENGVNRGKVQELWNIPSQVMKIIPGDKVKPILRYELLNDPSTTVQPEEIIHLKYWTPEYLQGAFLHGVSPIRAGRRVVSKSNSSYDAGTAAMQNSGVLGFISGNNRSDGAGMTQEQAEAIEEKLAKKNKATNRGKLFTTSADVKWQQIGMSPVDLAIIEGDKMDLRTICNIYHVPSELFNDASNKTYSNTKEAGRAIYSNAVIPFLSQFRDAFNQFLQRRGYDKNIYVDYDLSMIPELQDDLSGLITALQSAWWVTPNERRDMMSFGMIEDNPLMDDYFIPAGLIPLSQTSIDPEIIDEAIKRMNVRDYK